MSFINPINLKGLTTREAIADAFYRACGAVDEKDHQLFESALTSDVVLNVDGYEIPGLEKVRGAIMGTVDTSHYVTSVRIHVDGANNAATTAKLTANSLTQHYPAGMGATSGSSEKRFLRGAKHLAVLTKDETEEGAGLWRIKEWSIKTTWYEGDMSILQMSSS